MEVVVADDVALAAAQRLKEALREATHGARRAAIAVSGGETPWRSLDLLQPGDVEWPRVDVFQVDERVVPPEHPARNLKHLRSSFLSRLPAVARPMPVDASDLDLAAADYAAALPTSFDVVQLGLGADGHTASLMPRDPVLLAPGDVAVTRPYSGVRRMTLTFRPINRAKLVIWIVSGRAKRAALTALLAGEADIPANYVVRERATVIADAAALGRRNPLGHASA